MKTKKYKFEIKIDNPIGEATVKVLDTLLDRARSKELIIEDGDKDEINRED